MSAPHGHSTIYDSLRLSEKDQQNLLAKMNGRATSQFKAEGRGDDRHSYTARGMLVSIHQPGGSTGTYLVRPRNLSRNGIGFLHGSFCYPDTSVTVVLRTIENDALQITGKVARCVHVESTIHEVGVRFDEPVELYQIVHSAEPPTSRQDETSQALPQLNGNVLYVDDCTDDHALFTFMAHTIGLKVEIADGGEAALEALPKDSFDLVITDYNMPDMNGEQLFGKLRAAGYAGNVIAVTADEDESLHQSLRESGLADVLIKPYDCDKLIEVLSKYLIRNYTATDTEPMYSAMWENRKMRPVIMGFLERLEGRINQMQQLLHDNQNDELTSLVMEIKGTSGGFGYPQITDAAQHCIEQLGGGDTEAIEAKVNELAQRCAAACIVRRQPVS